MLSNNYQGKPITILVWDCLTLFRHVSDAFFCRGAGLCDATDFSSAQDKDAVAEFQKHIQVLTDEYDGNTLHLLFCEKVVDGIRCVDVQASDRIGGHQDGWMARDFTSHKHFLDVSA